MSTEKKYKILPDKIIDLVKGIGGCLATDKITVEGELVDYMYREERSFDVDSGWRFFSGTESQEYVDNADNSAIYDINTIANYDQAIISYLALPVGTQLERIKRTNKFQIIPG